MPPVPKEGPKRIYKCGKCGGLGHARLTCPSKDNLPLQNYVLDTAKFWIDERITRIEARLHQGMPLTLAAEAEGKPMETLEQLMLERPDIKDRIKAARSIGQMKLISEGYADFKGANFRQWTLERLNPKEFRLSNKIEQEITGSGGAPLSVIIVSTPEEAEEIAKREDNDK